jgi:enterobacteria phage integrase
LREIRAWEEHEIKKFEDCWPIGTKQRLAFSLMLYTGQRRSDVHRMNWADIEQNGIRVKQQKTGVELIIPIHAALQPSVVLLPFVGHAVDSQVGVSLS